MNPSLRRVYVVDDDKLVRVTMEGTLREENCDVVTFSSGQQFLDVAGGLDQGVVLLDVKMPGMDGLEVLARLVDRQINLPIVMISGHGDIAMAVKALRAGASDFIEKPFKPDVLLSAVKQAEARLGTVSGGTPPGALKDTPIGVLSQREVDVLRLLVEGDANKVVAYKLGISQRTVEVHRAKIMGRLSVKSFAELIRLAIASGL